MAAKGDSVDKYYRIEVSRWRHVLGGWKIENRYFSTKDSALWYLNYVRHVQGHPACIYEETKKCLGI